MNEQIKVGDLVVMVRGHGCLFDVGAGIPFTVTGFSTPTGGGWMCGYCSQANAGPNEVAALGLRLRRRAKKKNSVPAIPISWLKRIPPLEELDDVKHDETIEA